MMDFKTAYMDSSLRSMEAEEALAEDANSEGHLQWMAAIPDDLWAKYQSQTGIESNADRTVFKLKMECDLQPVRVLTEDPCQRLPFKYFTQSFDVTPKP